MRIAIGGFQHESHSFAPIPATWADFRTPSGSPALLRPATMVEALRHGSYPASGAIRAAEAQGLVIAPLSWATTGPSGPVTAQAFESMAALLLSDLQAAMEEAPLDGIVLELHGAMLAEGFPDAEGELLRRFRAVAGPDIPIAASLDPHCNLTAAMVAHSDVLVPYRTYPHVDCADMGARALDLLLRRIRAGRPYAKAFRQSDYWTPITGQCTLVPPMAAVMEDRAWLEARPGVVEMGFCFGFPYADFPDCGMAVACYAEDEAAAAQGADAFVAALARHESAFVPDLLPAGEAVTLAMTLARDASAPVVIADTQDNPGGGGHGDTTGLLRELVQQDARDATVAIINDDWSAAACHAAGEGARLSLSLGGRSDGVPFATEATVLRLSDGCFTCTGPMAAGNAVDLGPSALVAIGGVKVIVTSRKMQALDQAMLRHFGVEPAAEKILALKSSVHFRNDFQDIAARVLVALAPGPVVADPATLPFRNIRPGVRLRPGANRATA